MAAAAAAAAAVAVVAVAAVAAAAALALTSAFPLTLAVAVVMRAEVEGLKMGWRLVPDPVVVVVVLAVVAVVAVVLVLVFFVDKVAALESFEAAPPSLDAATRQTERSCSPRIIPSRLKMAGRAVNDRLVGSDGSGAFPATRMGRGHCEWP